MKTLSRHKTFIKDMRTVRLTDTQATRHLSKITTIQAMKANRDYNWLVTVKPIS